MKDHAFSNKMLNSCCMHGCLTFRLYSQSSTFISYNKTSTLIILISECETSKGDIKSRDASKSESPNDLGSIIHL